MRLSVLAVAAAAFGAVQADKPSLLSALVPHGRSNASSTHIATPTVIAPTAGQTIGTSVDLKYVNPDRTETNPRFASGLVVSLANSTINKAFNPGPKFPDDDPTTPTATLIVDSTELVEGEYSFVVIENGPSGSIFEKDFIVTLSFAA